MADEAKPACPGCAKRDQRISELEGRVRELERLVRDLTKRIQRTSSNSSIPPSADFMRQAKPKPPTGRKRGGQPGHEGSTRQPFPPAEVDRVIRFHPERCRGCRQVLTGSGHLVEAHQVSEVPANPAEVTEYRRYRRACPSCGLVSRRTNPPTTVSEIAMRSESVFFPPAPPGPASVHPIPVKTSEASAKVVIRFSILILEWRR